MRRKKHIHVELPCGAVATVAPDISPETLVALNRAAELVLAGLGPSTEWVMEPVGASRGEVRVRITADASETPPPPPGEE